MLCSFVAGLALVQGKAAGGDATNGLSKSRKTELMGIQQESSMTLDENNGICSLTGTYIIPKGYTLTIKDGVRLVAGKRRPLPSMARSTYKGQKRILS